MTVIDAPGSRAPVWPHGQVLAAAIDIAQLTGHMSDAVALADGLAPYASGDGYAPLPQQRRRYFDDNAWIGLDLVQLHLQSSGRRFLDDAMRVFRFVATGQDADGGVRWKEGARSRNACSTAPAVQLALRLALVQRDDASIGFALRSLRWLEQTLGLESGLFADRVDRWGRVNRMVWSYNQGAALGASMLAYRITDETAYLERAMRTAIASLTHLDARTTWRHPPVFNAVWFRNLLALDAVERVPGLDEALSGYLERAWEHGRDPETGLFTAGGIGSYDGTPAIDQAGLVQLFALRAWPRERLIDVC
jgi:Glycosyl hydrolase family 76